MILLTRLSGTAFVLNADLIERLDSTPDTVVTLVDGTKYVVAESMNEIADLVRTYRGEIIALGTQLGRAPTEQPARPTHLTPVADHPGIPEVRD
ncbi:flagellar FlbD family protein [Nocardioides euryhalodurans]|uniref:Flagellar protein FlbD n=1 Tax=Nocardioides euryhalodurans TaxID=2518370 RepID=A0A4P7GK04_9ACTN|nr:flagellar FlbD family protein [Nocardioides euryhalodurans]QBR92378.1 flagellar protein FlbD [Nocardioides euryhalodurans]